MKKLMFALMMSMTGLLFGGIAYQGQLRDAKGGALATQGGTVSIVFSLYTSPTGSDLVWRTEKTLMLDANGLFNVELSGASNTTIAGFNPTKPLVDDVVSWAGANGRELYIGLTVVNSVGEIRPRQKLLDVPISGFARNVKEAKDGFIVKGAASLTGGVTVDKQATFNDNVQIVKDLTVSGNFTLGGRQTELNIPNFRALTVGDKKAEVLPQGMIIMWSGSLAEIPEGWVLCDGSKYQVGSSAETTRTVPDLRDRFVVGAGQSYTLGQTGGEATHALTLKEMPPHTHSFTLGAYDLAAAWHDSDNFYSPAKSDKHQHTISTSKAGGGTDGKNAVAHENRPPFYALYYIMRLDYEKKL